MTYGDLLRIRNGLRELAQVTGSVTFAWAIARNLRAIDDELKEIDAIMQRPEGYEEYHRLHIELIREHAARDDSGAPITVGDRVRVADPELFHRELAQLRSEHADEIAIQEAREAEVQDLLGKQCDELHLQMIRQDIFPGAVTGNQLLAIYEIVDHYDGEG
jgi:hypothetical protein